MAVTPGFIAFFPPSATGLKGFWAGWLGWFTWLRILWVDGGYTGETFAQCGQETPPKAGGHRRQNAQTPPWASKLAAPLDRGANLPAVVG